MLSRMISNFLTDESNVGGNTLLSKDVGPTLSFGDKMYSKLKLDVVYDEGLHCPMVLNTFNAGGDQSVFLVKAGISRQKFTAWQMNHELFRSCVDIAKEIGSSAWIRDGLNNLHEKGFNMRLWESIGTKRFGSINKISLMIDSKATPIQQYQQLMKQATSGDFTSSELKQVMESINIGIRANEACLLQDEISELKLGLIKMEERELEHQAANQSFEKDNKVTMDS